jgi:hypothetical protein
MFMKKLLMSGIAALMLGGCYKDIKTEEKPGCNDGIFGEISLIEGQKMDHYSFQMDYRGGRTELKVRKNWKEIIAVYDGPPHGPRDGKIDLFVHEGKLVTQPEKYKCKWVSSALCEQAEKLSCEQAEELATKVQKIFDKYTRMISNICPNELK